MILQVLGHGQRVLRVALHPQMQRLYALKKEERVEGRQRRAGVTQTLDASLQMKASGPKAAL